ncbi:MAG TPA: ABC transporter permease [Gaiellaceae bacterium]
MLGFILRRLVWAALLFLIVTLYTYVLFFMIGSTSVNVGSRSSEAASTVNESVGVEGSFFVAYGTFLSKVVTGDLGQSFYTRDDVTSLIAEAAPVTASLVFGAAIMWLLIAVPIGILSALRPRSLLDRAGMVFVLVGISAHPLWVGYVLAYVFGYRLRWFPTSGYCDVLSASTSCGGPVQWAYHLVLPWLAFALGFAALYARMIRASVLEAMHEDYVRTAQAKGLGVGASVRRHALRNASLPVVTMLGMDVGLAFAGAVFVERVFGLPGVGSLLYTALGRRDMPVILGIVVLVTTAILVFNLIVDLVYGALDPRVRTVSHRPRRARAEVPAPAGASRPAPATST